MEQKVIDRIMKKYKEVFEVLEDYDKMGVLNTSKLNDKSIKEIKPI